MNTTNAYEYDFIKVKLQKQTEKAFLFDFLRWEVLSFITEASFVSRMRDSMKCNLKNH